MANLVFVFAAIMCMAFNAGAFNLAEIHMPKAGAMVPTTKACFADLIWRGFGIRPRLCPEGYEKDGDVCYKKCKHGYSGEGEQCLMNCPPGFSTTGKFCTNMWAKGCCCIGCCNACPADSSDIGCFCAKSIPRHSYNRGHSAHMICAPGQHKHDGLCYPACPAGYVGMGPMCWGGNQNHDYMSKCSNFLYARDESICALVHKELHFLEGGLASECVAALSGSTVMKVLSLEGAAQICKGDMIKSVNAINVILRLTNAQLCNKVSPYMCPIHTPTIGLTESVTISESVTATITETVTENISDV